MAGFKSKQAMAADKFHDEAARMLAEEIDWDIMCSVLKEVDWVEVRLEWPERMNEVDAHMIKEWCKANLKGAYKARGSSWMFSKKQDATLFILKWS